MLLLSRPRIITARRRWMSVLSRGHNWRHNSILNFLANTLQTVNGSSLYADVPRFKSPSIITGDAYRPDLLLSLSNGSLYVVELTVGYETNLENNVKRKKAKYRELVRQLDENFNDVNFVNLSMSSLNVRKCWSRQKLPN